MTLSPTKASAHQRTRGLDLRPPSLVDRLAGQSVGSGVLKVCDTRLKLHAPGRVADFYQTDKSGAVEYRFNSCGYRSEEFRPEAKFRLVVIGESHAIGIGVSFEKTFGFRLKQHIAGALDLALDEVNLINLAVGGASADYCTRTLYRQVPDLAADLVICVIPPPDRVEYFDEDSFSSFIISSIDTENMPNVPVPLLGFAEYYTEDVGRMNRVKNILLMQALLKARGIEYVLATEDLSVVGDGYGYIDPFLALLDDERLLRHQFFAVKADRGTDKSHAGPRSHSAFSIMVLHVYSCLLALKGETDRTRALEKRAMELMESEADWAFCTTASSR